ncbi:MAG: M15 family metallopeptidase, partial [Dehalococcoidia bacterium]
VLDWARRYRASPDAEYAGSAGNVPLAAVACPGGGTTTVHAQLAPAIAALYEAAAAAGVDLCGGGYRSPEAQIALRQAHCGSSDYAIYQMPASQCSPPTARPGQSMHERGLAIDFRCDGITISSRSEPCFAWLADHAGDYGLRNLPSEPWHFSTDGS